MKFAAILTVDCPCYNPNTTEEGDLEPCLAGTCAPFGDLDTFADFVRNLAPLVVPSAVDKHGLVEDLDGHLGGEGEYAYLAREHDREHPELDPWWAHHQGQWEGTLTEDQFRLLVEDAYWIPEGTPTMGTMTAEGVRPDIIVRVDSGNAICDGRITPYPEVGDEVYPKARAQHLVAEVLHRNGIHPWELGCDGGWDATRTWVLNHYQEA